MRAATKTAKKEVEPSDEEASDTNAENEDYKGTFNLFAQTNPQIAEAAKNCKKSGDWEQLYQQCSKYEPPHGPTAQITIDTKGESTLFSGQICDPMGSIGTWKVELCRITEKNILFQNVPTGVTLPKGPVQGIEAQLEYSSNGCGVDGGSGSFKMTKVPGWKSKPDNVSLYQGHVSFVPKFTPLYKRKGYRDEEEAFKCYFWAFREDENRVPEENDWEKQ